MSALTLGGSHAKRNSSFETAEDPGAGATAERRRHQGQVRRDEDADGVDAIACKFLFNMD